MLLDAGVDLAKADFGIHLLVTAAREGNESVVRLLIERGVNKDGRDGIHSPLRNAIECKQHGVAKLLSDLGAKEIDPMDGSPVISSSVTYYYPSEIYREL